MRKTGPTGTRSRGRVLSMVAVVALTALLTVACTQDPEEGSAGSTTSAPSGDTASTSDAVSGNECPYVVDHSEADFYPIQPSFSAGYIMSVQKLTSDTADWAYEVKAQFPYSNWTAWYLYNLKGATALQVVGQGHDPRRRIHQPLRAGQPRAGAPSAASPSRSCPATTPATTVSRDAGRGQERGAAPCGGLAPTAWPSSAAATGRFANDGLGDYDRAGLRAARPTRRTRPSRPSPPTRPPVRWATRSTTAVPRASSPRSSGTTDRRPSR